MNASDNRIRNLIMERPADVLCDFCFAARIAIEEIVKKTGSQEWKEISDLLIELRDKVLDAPAVDYQFTRLPERKSQ